MRNYIHRFKSSMDSAFLQNADGNAVSRRNAVVAGTMEAIVLGMTTGIFLTGLILNVLAAEPAAVRNSYLGLIFSISFLARSIQAVVPFIVKRIKTWPLFYRLTRGSYYLLQGPVMIVLLNLPVDGISKANGILIVVFMSEMLFFLANPLLCKWYLYNVPNASRPDWFSGQQLLVAGCTTLTVILSSFILDRFKLGGNFLVGLFVLRFAALVPGLFEFRANKRVKMPAENLVAEPGLTETLKSMRGNPAYLSNLLISCLFAFAVMFPGQYFAAYLLTNLSVSYTFISMMSVISVPMLLFAMPFWLCSVQRFGWYIPFIIILGVFGFVHVMLGFVIKETIWLYIIAMVITQFTSPGTNLISGGL
ncbi:MAG: hypothetical protein AAGU32_13385, partial [Bacillota bacterium]